MKRNLLNVALYQAGWFACILGAAHGRPWIGPLAATGLLGVHLALSEARGYEFMMAAAALVIGLGADGLLTVAGVLHFAEPGLAPWMPALWVLLATLFGGVLAWLSGRYLVAAALGAVGGPLAYLAGERLGALEVAEGREWAVALEWVLAFPALLWISDRLRARVLRRAA